MMTMTTARSRSRAEVESDIRETFGLVPSFFSRDLAVAFVLGGAIVTVVTSFVGEI
jgi:hypothetical protein